MIIRDQVKYVPAGLEGWNSRMGQVFVKFEKNKDTSIYRGVGYRVVRLVDRTIHIVYETSRNQRLIDTQFDFDYVVPYQNPLELKGRIDLVLVNPVHAKKGFYNNFRPHGIKTIADSGGFQMRSGVSDFVNPDNVVEFYNKHTDIGMALDLPITNSVEAPLWDKVSNLMAANANYMEKKLNNNVTLALISHGRDINLRKRRLEVIYRPSKVVAVGGLLNTTALDEETRLLTALNNALYVISETRKHAEYYHFLGVTSRLWIAIYAILVGTGYVKSCGGDSVSHRMAAITGSYKHSFVAMNTNSIHEKHYLNALHYKFQNTHDSSPTQITKRNAIKVGTSCCCPMCQAVSDLTMLSEYQLCESHLLWYSEQEKDLICDNVQSYLNGKISLGCLAKQCVRSHHKKIFIKMFSMIEDTVSKGFTPIKVSKQLFGSLNPTKVNSEELDRYTRIIKNYEKFHKKKFL